MNTSDLAAWVISLYVASAFPKAIFSPILAENKNDLAARMKWQNGHHEVLYLEYLAPQFLIHH